MSCIKKQRYKLLYKKFLRLDQNIQNRQKILQFKKQKWQKFLKKLKKKQIRNYRFYDQNQYSLPKFSYYFKNSFKNNLKMKQRLSLFYGGLLKKYLKTIITSVFNKAIQKQIYFNFFFIEFLESRLDIILYRAHFAFSIGNARQLISHGHVYVNKRIVKNQFFMLKKGDCIEISPTIADTIKQNISDLNLWPIPPKYIQINYKIFQIICIEDKKFTNFSLHFPFKLHFNLIIKNYKF